MAGKENMDMSSGQNEEKMITMQTDDGESVDFYVLEETKINGMNYLMVTDAGEEEEEGEVYILKDLSGQDDTEAVYEFVEDDDEMEYLYKIFTELLEDVDIEIRK